jgi:protein transport protein SEC31
VPQSVSGVQYPDSYQQPFDPRYGSGYNAPAQHQQPQQPNLFVPSQATQVPQAPQVHYHINVIKKEQLLLI